MPVFGPAQKAKLSLHGRHLANAMEASRDHVRMAAVVFGAASVYTAHAWVKADGLLALGTGVALVASVGYTAVKLYQHARTLDRKIDQLAMETGQDAPSRDRSGLIATVASQQVVAAADPIRPDLVKALANRRERRWDAALDPNYRPPVRTPRASS